MRVCLSSFYCILGSCPCVATGTKQYSEILTIIANKESNSSSFAHKWVWTLVIRTWNKNQPCVRFQLFLTSWAYAKSVMMTVPFLPKDGTKVNTVKYITTRYYEWKLVELCDLPLQSAWRHSPTHGWPCPSQIQNKPRGNQEAKFRSFTFKKHFL
jgi:hypothetical protein